MSNYWISSDFEDDFRNANMAVRCAYLLVVCKQRQRRRESTTRQRNCKLSNNLIK